MSVLYCNEDDLKILSVSNKKSKTMNIILYFFNKSVVKNIGEYSKSITEFLK